MTDKEKLALEKEALTCIFRRIESGVDGDISGGGKFCLCPDGKVKIENDHAFLVSNAIDGDGGFFVFTVAYVKPKN